MKKTLKLCLALGALCLGAIGFSAESHADSKRMTLYEINKFLQSFDDAVSRQDIYQGQSFFERNVSNKAKFHTVLMQPYYNQLGYSTVRERSAYGYDFRYPTPYSVRLQPVRTFDENKAGLIALYHAKKLQIPGYAQETVIKGFTMESQAKHAKVDVKINEYASRYNAGYGYERGYLQSYLQHQSDCVMNLSKKSGNIVITGMTCELVSY